MAITPQERRLTRQQAVVSAEDVARLAAKWRTAARILRETNEAVMGTTGAICREAATNLENCADELDASLAAHDQKVRAALQNLLVACLAADANEELSEFIDGSLLDAAKAALATAPPEQGARHNVSGASPVCLDCNKAGLRNCSHFDNCDGTWVYKTDAAHDQKVRESLAAWMIENSFATGHGDTVEDLLKELKWQIEERKQKVRAEAIEEAAQCVESQTVGGNKAPGSASRVLLAAAIRSLASGAVEKP